MKKSPPKSKGKVKKIVKKVTEPKVKRPNGRPTTVTPEVVSKLREAFMLDYTDEEACDYAEITTESYYRRHRNDEGFRHDMERAKRGLFKAAKRAIATAILKGKNPNISLNLLKHRQSERYRTKNETDQPMVGSITMVLPGSKPHPRILSESEAAGLSDDL